VLFDVSFCWCTLLHPLIKENKRVQEREFKRESSRERVQERPRQEKCERDRLREREIHKWTVGENE
jgi:hypothetical protein